MASRAVASAGWRTPRLALAVAGALGSATALIRRGHTRHLRLLFPELRPAAMRRLGRQILALEMQNNVIRNWWKVHPEAITPLIGRTTALEALERPVILATFHAGLLHALRIVLDGLPSPVRVAHTWHEDRGPRELFEALETLKGGGLVAVVADGPPTRLEVPFLGRTISLARGAFALSRIARVPIVPVLFAWRNGCIVPVVGEAIVPPECGAGPDEALQCERALAAAVAEWYARHVRENHGDVGLRTVLQAAGVKPSR